MRTREAFVAAQPFAKEAAAIQRRAIDLQHRGCDVSTHEDASRHWLWAEKSHQLPAAIAVYITAARKMHLADR
jgi:hypothetical protein